MAAAGSVMRRRMKMKCVFVGLLGAACLVNARQLPAAAGGQPGSGPDGQQQRSLLASSSVQGATKQQAKAAPIKVAHTAQLGSAAGGLPPFVGGNVPHAQPLQRGPGGNFNGGGGFNGGGVNGASPRWLGIAGVTANAASYGVDVGTALLAPIVNGVASNIPLLIPAVGGECLRGGPVFIPGVNVVMCAVGNAATVTNYLFRAADVLVDATARGVGLASQIAWVASGR